MRGHHPKEEQPTDARPSRRALIAGAGGLLIAAAMPGTRLAEQGHPGVRPRHGTVLAVLPADGARATELARRSGQHKQIVGVIVDELVQLGYVRRERDPSDRRAKLVVPIEAGLDEISKARTTLARIEQRHRQELGEEAYRGFMGVLEHINRSQRAWRQA